MGLGAEGPVEATWQSGGLEAKMEGMDGTFLFGFLKF
jgi:hypothetical protein